MNPYWKKKWLEALHSGEYKQGKRALRRSSLEGDKFCCLGVLCAIVQKEMPNKIAWSQQDNLYGIDNFFGSLPESLTAITGVHYQGYIANSDKSLVDYNDHLGYSFKQIADIIEKEF